MTIAVLVITDGRDEYLGKCVASATENLGGPISEWWMYDDTGDEGYRRGLRSRYPDFRHIENGARQGFAGAIRASWNRLDRFTQAEWIFHIEQDFLFTRPVCLSHMIDVMKDRPYLLQMALRRQAWNAEEIAAGGIVEMDPASFTSKQDQLGQHWLEHRKFWTTNPSLYKRSLLKLGWPTGARSEGQFTAYLLQQRHEHRFGYWGARDSGVWVEHIGHTRQGRGY